MKTFVKQHHGVLEDDWKRVNLLFSYAEKLDGISAPRPLTCNQTRQTISYQFIDQLTPCYHMLSRDLDKAAQLGCALAQFHQAASDKAVSVDEQHAQLSRYSISESDLDRVLEALPCSFFMGDAWHGNLFFHADGDIVLLDPLPNERFFPVYDLYANALLDIATLYMSFFVCHPLLRSINLDVSRMQQMADRVLASYLGYFKARDVAPMVRVVAAQIATYHVDGFRQRVTWPIGQLKAVLGAKVIEVINT